jgi:hypothetical protein
MIARLRVGIKVGFDPHKATDMRAIFSTALKLRTKSSVVENALQINFSPADMTIDFSISSSPSMYRAANLTTARQ